MNRVRALCRALAAALPAMLVLCTLAPAATAAGGGGEGGARQPWAMPPVATVGKLFVEANGRLVLCSGAIVDAPNGSVISTAAHCAQEVGGPRPRAWFVPGYERGFDAFRRDGWRVRSAFVPAAWIPGGTLRRNLPHDYAFLTVERKDGRTIQQAHGANGLAFEPVREELRVLALGYPAAGGFDGERLRFCEGDTHVLRRGEAVGANLGGLLLKDCGLTQGASGGPWIQGFDHVAGRGTVVGVTSVGTGDGAVVGRPYPESARALYERAGAVR